MVLSLLVGGLVTAWTAKGYDKPEFDLHDGGIWVTSPTRVGRLNPDLQIIDAQLATTVGVGLYQAGATVLVNDGGAGVVRPVDVRFASFGPDIKLGPGATVGLGGLTAAVLVGRKLWVGPADRLGAMGIPDGPPSLTLRGEGVVAVGVEGSVHVLERGSGEVVRLDGQGSVVDRQSLGVDDLGKDAQVSALGHRTVVLDPGTRRLLAAGEHPVELAGLGNGLVIQQPGPENPAGVLVAGTKGLASVRPGSTPPAVVHSLDDVQGGPAAVPAAPVFVSGCAYGAWSGTGGKGMVALACAGAKPSVHDLGATGRELLFRVNRGRAVLNDTATGVSWVVSKKEARKVDDWSEALNGDGAGSPTTTTTILGGVGPSAGNEEKKYDRSAANRPPVAVADALATRPGRPSVLDLLDNDSDPDLDLLVVAPAGPLPENEGRLDVVDDGESLQFTPAPGRTDPVVFDYEVNDGRGGTATAKATVSIHPEAVNEPPTARSDRARVGSGKSIDYNVLANDADPDGDGVSLAGVGVDPAKGTVQFRPDGLVTYTAAGGVTGSVALTYQAVDEYGAGSAGEFVVEVSNGNLPPVARDDLKVTFAGRDAVVELLVNDADPNRDPLSVVKVQERSDATVTWTPQGRLRFRADKPASYDLLYTVSDGTAVADALIRVEVLVSGERHAPVAVRDEAIVRPGVATVLAPLANDVDLDGDVLVLQRVAGAPPSLVVEVLERQYLRIRATEPLAGPVAFTYLVTDGGAQATGTVVARPAPASSVNQAPVANPDEVSVRADNVTGIDVLANDVDPDGDSLRLAAVEDVAPTDGVVFAQGRELRYQAPTAERGAVAVRYTAIDDAGNKAAGTLTIHVTPADPARNQPPQPRQLEARLFSGRTTTVTVPLVGVDPDGDAVSLLGQADPPALGEILAVGPDSITYRAFADAVGTDRFTYRVRDPYGAEATGVVLVGIAPPPDVNSPPVAVPDAAGVRPGATVQVRVLANDSDPDDDQVSIPRRRDAVGVPRAGRAVLSKDRQAIVFSAPRQPGSVSFDYALTDGRGTLVRGLVTVIVADDAPQQVPSARDDVVAPQAPGKVVTVDVLANDDDPDSDTRSLTVSVAPGSGATVRGRKVRLVMPDRPVSLIYTVTDKDKLSARAFVIVPRLTDLPPVAGPDVATTAVNTAVTVDVLANDKDPDKARLHLLRVLTTRSGSAEIAGSSVRFTPSPDFVGDSGFTYQVSDKPDGQNGNVAVGTASVTVTGNVNRPPVVTRATLAVPAGGERSVDLASVATDPEGDRLAFSGLTGPPKGLAARIDGTTLTVSADDTTPRGTEVSLAYTVDDGKTGGRVQSAAVVTVTGSDKPKPQAVADATETNQGSPVTADVASNDVDPLGKGLAVSLVTQSPNGSATVSANKVVFSPNADFFGTTSVSYAITDATNDPDRKAVGTLAVTVYGRPSPPPAPAGTAENKAVALTWGVPAANGAPIDRYIVRWTGGERQCSSNACRIDGLVNGTVLRFTVTAVNRAGESAPSAASPDLVPNALAAVPGAPTATFGDKQITIAWQPPANEGTPIDQYVVQVSPPPASGPQTQQVAASASPTYTWTGLANGTAYSFRIRARNSAGETEFGPASNPEIPAGVPLSPSAPTALRSDARLVVSWTVPQANGDAVVAYEIVPNRNGTDLAAVAVNDPAQRTLDFPAENGQTYTFKMRARNKAGWSAWSPASSGVIPAGVPLTITSVTAAEGDRQAQLTFTNPGTNGAAITRYESSTNSGAAATLAANRIVSSLTNGTDYTFRVRACNDVGCGQWSPASNQVNPFGAPGAPGISSSVGGTTITWNWSAPAGNGRPITGYEFRVDGGGYQGPTGATSHAQGFGYSETHTLCVRAVNSGGLRSTDSCNSNTTGAPPPPPASVTLSRGTSAVGQPGCSSAGCSYFQIDWSGLPTGNKTYTCHTADGANFFSPPRSFTLTAGGSSGSAQLLVCYADASAFGGVYVVVAGTRSNTATW